MNPIQYLSFVIHSILPSSEERWDAKVVAILDKQLEWVKQQTFDIVYPDKKGRLLVPINNEVDPGAETITWRQWDEFGAAKIISNWADDLPNVDALVEEFTSKVQSIGASYSWTIQDLRRSAMAGAQLDSRRARSARRAIEDKIEDVLAFGLVNAGGITGLLNNANISLIVAPTPGAWSTLTAIQILDNMQDFVDQVVVGSKETFVPDTYVIDIANFRLISGKVISTTGDTGRTVLKAFKENNPGIEVISWDKSALANAGGTGPRHVLYQRSPDVLSGEIPQEFEQLPPQPRNLSFVVPVHARVGGVLIYYPISMGYQDGV